MTRDQQLLTSDQRLLGIDLARGAALLGMMTTHLLPSAVGGEPTFVGAVLSGRAAALFAVLAGVSLTLGSLPARQNKTGLTLRALVIAAVGLSLGLVDVGIAVILVHYALLFWCTIPVLSLRPQTLGLLATCWLLLSPLAAFLMRPPLLHRTEPLRLGHNPSWADLGDLHGTATLLSDLLVTGYYPVLQWFGYVLLGLWLGHLPLKRASTQAALLLGGTSVAALSLAASWVLMHPLGGLATLLATPQAADWPLATMLQTNLSGVDQSGSWWWLATAAPHSGTSLDLLQSSGWAAAALGAFLLIARLRPLTRTGLLLPLAGAGSMTLSLYCAHVWAVSRSQAGDTPGASPELLTTAHLTTALAVGLLFAANRWRGPLEWLTHGAYRLGAPRR